MKTFSNSKDPYNKSDPIPLKFVVFLVKHKKCRWLIQCCALIFHVSAFIFPTIDKNEKFYAYMRISEATLKCMDFVEFILVIVTNVFGFVFIQLNIGLFDAIFALRNKLGNAEPSQNLSRGIVTLHVLVLLFMPFSTALLAYQFEPSTVKYPMAATVEYWCFTITVAMISCIIQYIKGILQNANQFLVVKMFSHFRTNGTPGHVILNDVKFITKHHNNICNLLDDFNNKSKGLLALLLLSMNIIILWDIGLMILVGTKFPNDQVESHSAIFVACSFMALIMMGQGAIAAWAGEQLAEEGYRTTKICYQLLNSVPANMGLDAKKQVEKQLHLLLEQSKSHKVYIHAGGFFQVNFGLLGSIASTVTTYSIVIVQFLLKSNSRRKES